jgi:tight adherence protein B
MLGPLLFGILLAISIAIFFLALRGVLETRDPVDARLKEYGLSPEMEPEAAPAKKGSRRSWPVINRLINGFGLGPMLANDLARADLKMTAAEYAMICIAVGTVAGLIVAWRAGPLVGLAAGPLVGLAAGALAACAPIIYLRMQAEKRVTRLTEQLPDVLTLLVGALRAGYGLPQALALLTEQLPPPASVEFGRVLRAISLGMPVPRALGQMADRMNNDDLALMVTAIGVQYELGGNLAQTLETINDTVRDRLKLHREIRTLTAQQRLTGNILAGLPFFLGIAMYFINSEYIMRLFAPGRIRMLPAAAAVMMVIGFLVIGKIVDIEV